MVHPLRIYSVDGPSICTSYVLHFLSFMSFALFFAIHILFFALHVVIAMYVSAANIYYSGATCTTCTMSLP
jgi:hypothetical protein